MPGSRIRASEPQGGSILKRYEVIFISLADLSSDETDGVIEKYTSIISDLDGKIVKIDKWGKRRLAYQIRKKREGVYTLIEFGSENKVIQELERNFKIDDKILRYQSVKLEDNVDPDALEREIEEAQKKETPPEVPPAEEKPAEPAIEATTETEESTDEPKSESSPETTEPEENTDEPKSESSPETTEPEENTDKPKSESSPEEKTGE